MSKSKLKLKDLFVLDTFYSYAKRCGHHGALNTLTCCIFHSVSKPEGALAKFKTKSYEK